MFRNDKYTYYIEKLHLRTIKKTGLETCFFMCFNPIK